MKTIKVGCKVLSQDFEGSVCLKYIRFDKVRVFEAPNPEDNKEVPFQEHRFLIATKQGSYKQALWLSPDQLFALKELFARQELHIGEEVEKVQPVEVH